MTQETVTMNEPGGRLLPGCENTFQQARIQPIEI